MMNTEFTAWNATELRVYRILGVASFRKAILWFEKVRHFRSKRKNENYHPSNLDVFSLEQYNGFLLYNAFLHAASLFFTAVYVLLSVIFEFHSTFTAFSIVIPTLLNIYCILLQRANYLRTKKTALKYYMHFSKRTDRIKEDALRKVYAREPEKLQTDYEVLSRIKKAMDGQADCVLTHADTESLKRICSCLEDKAEKQINQKKQKTADGGLIEKCTAALGPYTVLQARVDWLQRKFRVPGRKMLDRTAIITMNAECERLCRKLFPEDTAYTFCRVCFPLYKAFTGMIGKVDANAV